MDHASSPAPSAVTLDAAAILGLIAHRYPVLLVDRIEVVEPGRRVVGYKAFTAGEWAGAGGTPSGAGALGGAPFGGTPLGGAMLGSAPGVSGLLVVEALAQTSAALLLGLLADPAGAIGYFVGMERVRLRVPPRPGDEVRLAVDLASFRRGIAYLRGEASVAGRVAATARFTTIVRGRAS